MSDTPRKIELPPLKHPDELVDALHPGAYWKGINRCLDIVQKEIRRLQRLEAELLIGLGIKPAKVWKAKSEEFHDER